MKNNIVNYIEVILIVILTVGFNLFSNLRLTADGIIGNNSIFRILASFFFVFVWIFGSFYNGYKNEGKVIGFLSMVYLLIFMGCLIYNGIFLIFAYMIAPFLPIVELLKISNILENGNLIFSILCLLSFFFINIVANFLGNKLNSILV